MEISSGWVDAVIGKGGVEKLQQITDEIENNIKQQEEEVEEEKGKTFGTLEPIYQLLLLFDKNLESLRKYQEADRLRQIRKLEFDDYVYNVYGIKDY